MRAPRPQVRLNDIRRSPATVRPGVLEFCLLQSPTSSPSRRPVFGVDWDLLEKARVVVASCSSAAVLQPLLESRAGYDYVVVDEAAQALVPEALIPLTLAAQGGSSVTVLAGDPRQLGPTVRCRYSAAAPALRHSLQQLWLHRAGGGLGEDVHVLPRNYRSSAPLLELPSRMFYGDCLVAEAPEENTRVPDWVGSPLPPSHLSRALLPTGSEWQGGLV